MPDEKGPIGTLYGECPDCHSESDHICPVCHPECEAAFKPLTEAPETGLGASRIDPTAPVALDDLHHIEMYLKGAWTQQDLANLAVGFQAAAEAAKEDGLIIEIIAIRNKKTSDQFSVTPSLNRAMRRKLLPFNGKIRLEGN